jgi:hypothetical protein
MHGMIMDEIKRYVEAKYGESTWKELLKQAGVGKKTYYPVMNYPDKETLQIVATASQMTGLAIDAILEDFGQFIVPDLADLCSVLLKPHWKTLDFLENTEHLIHEMIRRHWRVQPPILECERVSVSEVLIKYGSPRKMCSVAKGIAKGVAQYYHQSIILTEKSCMNHGHNRCLISVRLYS